VLQSSAVNLTVGNELIGYGVAGAHAAHTQSNGTNTNTGLLHLGFDTGSVGTYNLSGNGVLQAQTNNALVYIGENGIGVFNQSGGSFTVGSVSANTPLYLGYAAGSSGTYNLSGGTLTTYSPEFIGFNVSTIFSAVGSFVQTGGTHTAATIYLGYHTGSSGIYNLSGTGTLSVTAYEAIGTNNGIATFTQTGGTHTTATLDIAASSGAGSNARGIYNLGGTGLLAVTGSRSGTASAS
jgi:hypothetical protein